ncbi:hypothetical protein [Halomonas endophytica]|uniref:hypothetical protein n=1 Tax=Billgrantia endophytica TaxID=2033802 RepID=UPI001F0B8D05
MPYQSLIKAWLADGANDRKPWFSLHDDLMLAAMPRLDTLPHRYGKQRIETCLFTPPTKTFAEAERLTAGIEVDLAEALPEDRLGATRDCGGE